MTRLSDILRHPILLLAATLLLLSGCQSESPPEPPTSVPPSSPTVEAAEAAVAALPTPVEAESLSTPDEPTPTPSPSPTPPIATATPEAAALPPPPTPVTCDPTPPDAMGPFYTPDAPERNSVGSGHLLRGMVRSSAGCAPIANAQLEFWLTGPDGDYGDDYRATLFAGDTGAYQFESNPPLPYASRPPHIHLRVTAQGYVELVTQYYPEVGQTEGVFDLVLQPESGSSPAPSANQPNAALPQPTLFDVSWQERTVFEAGLTQEAQPVLQQLPQASVFHIDMTIAEDRVNLTGRQELRYTNAEIQPLERLYLRLYPNLTGGSARISNLTLNGRPVEPTFELQNSALLIPLEPALQPNQAVVIALDFEIGVPEGKGGNYGTFAYAEGVLALPHFYPMPAVFDDEGWNVEIAPPIGDVIYADSSFYLVRVTAPADQTLAASGIVTSRERADDRQTVTFAAGPVRDFYLAAGEDFTTTSRIVGETTIHSHAPTDLGDGASAALDFTEQALQSFNSRFGPYPFTEFDMVSTTTFALGVEYPGIVALLIDLYEQPNAGLMESVVAHEVGHQWFYSTVGNDQVDEPWLDEALAQYATLLYYTDVYGQVHADSFRSSLERRWNRVGGADIPIGLPVREYTTEEYSAIVYGRGPLFMEALAEAMGPEIFAEFLRDYYQRYRWQNATGADFKTLAEQHCACDLTGLFETWVYAKEDEG